MSFKKHQDITNTPSYKISLKSPNGNTVAFVNLTSQFLKAVVGKTKQEVSVEDINSINNGDLVAYLASLTVAVESVEPQEVISAEEY